MGNEIAEGAPAPGKLKATQIAVRPGSGISFANAGEVMAFANMMAEAGSAVPAHLRQSPGACLGVIDDSIRFGLSPFYCARQSYFVNDQLAYMAQLFAAVLNANLPLIKRPIYSYAGSAQIEDYTDDGKKKRRAIGDLVCRVELHLVGGQVIEHFSPPVGMIKNQKSPLWVVDTKQQIAYYTIRSAARLHFSDVLAGAYDIDEAAAMAELAGLADTGGSDVPSITGKPKTDIGKKLREGRENGNDHRDYSAGNGDDPDRDSGKLHAVDNGNEQRNDAAGASDDRTNKSEHKPDTSADAETAKTGDAPDTSLLAAIQNALPKAATRLDVEAVAEAYRDEIASASEETQSLVKAAIDAGLARFPEKARRRTSAASKL